jgi:hypothetical protein
MRDTSVLVPTTMGLSARSQPASPNATAADDKKPVAAAETSDMAAAVASLEVQWAKKKAQWLAHFRSGSELDEPNVVTEEEGASPKPTEDWNCHVCNITLGLLKRVRRATLLAVLSRELDRFSFFLL